MGLRLSEVLKDIDLRNFRVTGDPKTDMLAYCRKGGLSPHEYGNVIAYRMSFGETLTVHTVTGAVAKKVVGTRILMLPPELPGKMKSSFLFEAKEGALFDDVVAIGGFLLDGDLVLLSVYEDGESIWQHSIGNFGGRKLEDIQFDRTPTESEDGKKVVERAARKDTFAFATILSIMLEAERSPILLDEGSKKAKKRNKLKQAASKSDWVERRIYIDAKYRAKETENDPVPMDKEGKIKKDVFISGFLRHQPYGPGRSLRKWVYVDGFASSRWVAKDPRKVTIVLREGDRGGDRNAQSAAYGKKGGAPPDPT